MQVKILLHKIMKFYTRLHGGGHELAPPIQTSKKRRLRYFFNILQVIQTFGAFRLTLFPLWPGLASFPSCLGRRVPVRLQIRPDLITVAHQNVLSHILFEGWTENNMHWYFASCAVFFFWMDLTKGLASQADDLRALSCVSVPQISAEMSGYKHKPITAHSLLRCDLFVDK